MSTGRFQKISLALLCTANLGLSASAQNPTRTQPAVAQDVRVVQQPNIAQHADQHQTMIASCLVYENQVEVALGRMAQEKAQSGAVKKFAGMMVQEHQDFLAKLQKFAPNSGELSTNLPESQDRSSVDVRGETDPQVKQNQNNQAQNNKNPNSQENIGNAATQQQAGKSNEMAMNVIKLQQELAQQCLSDAQSKLSKEGSEKFDKCYVGMQIAMHAGMKTKLTVFSRHSTGEFKQLIEQAIQTTDNHLAKAESLMEELDSGSASTSSADRASKRDSTTEKGAVRLMRESGSDFSRFNWA